MPIKKQKIIDISIIIAPSFLIGLISGKLLNWPLLKLDNKVSITEILSLVVTFIVAYFISKVVEKEKLDNREGKNIIIKRLDEILRLIDEATEKIVANSLYYSEAASFTKRMYSNFESVFDATKKCNVKINSVNKEFILVKTRQLKKLLTDTPKIGTTVNYNSNLPLQVKNNIIQINKNRQLEIEKEFDSLKRIVFELQIEINLS